MGIIDFLNCSNLRSRWRWTLVRKIISDSHNYGNHCSTLKLILGAEQCKHTSMSKKIILVSFSVFLFTLVLAFGVNAQATGDALTGLDSTAGKVTAFKNQTKADTNFIQSQSGILIGTVLSFVGVLFLIMMIYAGIIWMTAQGNDQQVTKAKDLLINSIIGIIIVFAAYAITAYVGDFVSNQLTK